MCNSAHRGYLWSLPADHHVMRDCYWRKVAKISISVRSRGHRVDTWRTRHRGLSTCILTRHH